MTSSALQILDELPRPLHRAVRRLRWFSATFREQVKTIEAKTGLKFSIEERKVTSAFLDWLRAFEAQKPSVVEDRRAYVGFAAGLMLRSLLKQNPLGVVRRPEGLEDDPALFWPEGYAYVSFCLNVRSAVLTQDFKEDRQIAPAMSQIRTWWSFKENVAEDPSIAVAFLDRFAGEEPDWNRPAIFRPSRPPSLR